MITLDDVLAGFNAVFYFLGEHISTLLLIGGFFAGFYFIYRFFKGKPEEGEDQPTILKVMMYLGVIVGVIMIGGAINAWGFKELPQYDYEVFTIVLAIIVGIALLLRPIKDVPWAAIIGVIAGSIVVFICASYLEFVINAFADLIGINPYWILIILFVLILLLTYLAFKMIEDLGKFLGGLLSARPTSFIIMVVCAVEAILVFMGYSLWIW
ncbi:MAG: hypothetical protein HWN66_10860 [Candidatus Helarchaeota archaeon]|nr:hypothetical protein [Candidatus Helarchaeota archaeon]